MKACIKIGIILLIVAILLLCAAGIAMSAHSWGEKDAQDPWDRIFAPDPDGADGWRDHEDPWEDLFKGPEPDKEHPWDELI